MCAFTYLSAQGVVHRGSSVPTSIPPSNPLKLAQADIFPVAGAIFKTTTNKSSMCFIHYKKNNIVLVINYYKKKISNQTVVP